MGKLVLVLLLLLVLAVGGTAVFLTFWEPPMQPATLEIPVPNDRLSLQ